MNGKTYTRDVEPRTLLVHFIREDLGLPVLIGSSRKRFLAGAVTPEVAAEPLARDDATAATTALAALAGAWAVRVHEVPANRDAVRTASLWKEPR